MPPPEYKLDQAACARVGSQCESLEMAGRWMFEDATGDRTMTDMEFVLDGGRRVQGHQTWLAARCEHIRRELESGSTRMRVQGFTEGAFTALLEFIYTGRLGATCKGQEWGKLFELAKVFGMKGMEDRLLEAQAPKLYDFEAAARLAVESNNVSMMERCISQLPPRPSSAEGARSAMRAVDVLLGRCGRFNDPKLLGKAVDTVVGSMQSSRDDAFVQESGCIALGKVSGLSAENRKMTAAKGGIEATVLAMRRHRGCAQIQIRGCAALCNLTLQDEKIMALAGEAGAIEAVVDALNAHSGNYQVQQHGCSALRNLTWEDRNAQRVGEAGVRAVLKAVKNLKESTARVQEFACSALSNLAWVDKIRRFIVASGGIAAVVQVLNRLAVSLQFFVTRRMSRVRSAGCCRSLVACPCVLDILSCMHFCLVSFVKMHHSAIGNPQPYKPSTLKTLQHKSQTLL